MAVDMARELSTRSTLRPRSYPRERWTGRMSSTRIHSHPRTLNRFLHSQRMRLWRRVEPNCPRHPHAIHATLDLSTRLSTALWALEGSQGEWHERALMHTRAELSTNTGVLSTDATSLRECCRACPKLRIARKIRGCAPTHGYPQRLWITRPVVDN